ncbi:hypothetical protein [Andreprevotia chitinilytica]|uniref:hypothetical protein n=1 Tax=Andreprevotia chitinilytica TaxID=396808 RepID=UPI0012EB9C04|nr:hypothetical protein [Andreprevotia chitinilytica]
MRSPVQPATLQFALLAALLLHASLLVLPGLRPAMTKTQPARWLHVRLAPRALTHSQSTAPQVPVPVVLAKAIAPSRPLDRVAPRTLPIVEKPAAPAAPQTAEVENIAPSTGPVTGLAIAAQAAPVMPSARASWGDLVAEHHDQPPPPAQRRPDMRLLSLRDGWQQSLQYQLATLTVEDQTIGACRAHLLVSDHLPDTPDWQCDSAQLKTLLGQIDYRRVPLPVQLGFASATLEIEIHFDAGWRVSVAPAGLPV